MDFTDFTDIEFPQHKEIVYFLYFIRNEGDPPIPLYVGESSKGVGRFGDYISAQFTASTDFKVGEAIRYLRSHGFSVRIKYKESKNRERDESKIIKYYKDKSRLLNEYKGFKYTESNEDYERARLHKFIRTLIKENGVIINPSKSKLSPTQHRCTNRSQGSSIAYEIQDICRELGEDDKTISRQDILSKARERGINTESVSPADYCDNTPTGKWSPHKFLHWVDRGKYELITPSIKRAEEQ